MTTDVDICNLALGSLGVDPITALGSATQEERTCSLFYLITLNNYLTEHSWSFATKIVELVEETTEVEGYDWAKYKFVYPSNCLKAQRVTNGETGYEYPFVIRDIEIAAVDVKLIFTNLQEAFLEYTIGLTDPDLFSSTFTSALSKKLAFEMSFPLTKDAKVQKQAFDQFLLADNLAKQKDSSEQLPESRPLTWEQSRTGMTRFYSISDYGLYY